MNATGPDRWSTDVALAQRLVAAQFPHWAHLPVRRLAGAGTVNAIYRLGEALSLRLPERRRTGASAAKEQFWLPWLAPHLNLSIPEVVAEGVPGEGYPWTWFVYGWMDGASADAAAFDDEDDVAERLGRFVAAMRTINADGAPEAGIATHQRGLPLQLRDHEARRAIAAIADEFDAGHLSALWDDALNATMWDAAPVWFHGDLHRGNLIVRDGELSGVIDFGQCGAGDPACDLIPAWWIFSAGARAVFLGTSGADMAMQRRGRGWALWQAVVGLAHYRVGSRNPGFTAMCRQALNELVTAGNRAPG